MPDPGGGIGIFDSGVGGLTVLRQVAARLPGESFVYLGDTARVPYGTKSPQTVIRYARQSAEILLRHGIKMLVVACNTASAFALDALREHLEVPVLGVIEPGARAAAQRSVSGRIGVIGTAGTMASGAYPAALARLAPSAQVFSQACPLFVPLAEEGWTQGEVPRAVAGKYMRELLKHDIDTLILGCTHYPLLSGVIAETAGPTVALVDSAEETALAVQATIAALGLRNPSDAGERRFLVSDAPESFARVGERFLGYVLNDVNWIDF